MDDGTIGGDLKNVINDIKKIQRNTDITGLSLNPNKCEVFYSEMDKTNKKLIKQKHMIS